MKPGLVPAVLLLCCVTGAGAADYPQITRLDAGDVFFSQLQGDIEAGNAAYATGSRPPALVLYSYRTGKNDDLFSLAARLTLPYEALATLNGINGPGALPAGKELIVPNQPGVFVPEKAETDLDRLMLSWRKASRETVVVTRKGKPVTFRFFSGERFHPLERAYFLGILFRFPLPQGVISSGYGMRADPFTGASRFHGGLDIAAPTGTDVYAASGGIVKAVGTDAVLGNFVVLSHFGNHETVYGHLHKVLVQLAQQILSGEKIGSVGSTGSSTGSHLHFEIRSGGRARNPEVLLSRGKE